MKRDIFNAIADPTRRNILMSLTAEPQNINALAKKYDMTRQAVSLHVKYLQECGVIRIEQQGRERYCQIELQKMVEIKEWLKPFIDLWEARFSELDKVLLTMKNENQSK